MSLRRKHPPALRQKFSGVFKKIERLITHDEVAGCRLQRQCFGLELHQRRSARQTPPSLPKQPVRQVSAYNLIRTTVREPLRAYLKEQGVETLVHWQKPMWEHKGLGLAVPDVPETLAICRDVVSLPMSAETTEAQVEQIVAALRVFFSTQP